MSDSYEVTMTGGGPWGIRLNGGKDFGVPLNASRITPNSKASMKGVREGDRILSINNNNTDSLTHLEAQNLIKAAGESLHLGLKRGPGGGPTWNVNTSSASATRPTDQLKVIESSRRVPAGPSPPMKRVDAAEYARKKKEELENLKKEQKPDAKEEESDVLKMLKRAALRDEKEPTGLAQHQQSSKAQQQSSGNADSDDQSDEASKNLFPKLRHVPRVTEQKHNDSGTDDDDKDFPPPPPPQLLGLNDPSKPQTQSSVFRLLDNAVKEGRPEVVRTGLDSPGRIATPPGSPYTSRRPLNQEASNSLRNKSPIPSDSNYRSNKGAAVGSSRPAVNSVYTPQHAGTVGSSRPAVDSKYTPQHAGTAKEILDLRLRQYADDGQSGGLRPQATNTSAPGPPQAAPSSAPQSPRVFKFPPQSAPHSPRTPGQLPQATPSQGAAPGVPTPGGRQPVGGGAGGRDEVICQECQQPVEGSFVSAIGKTWHPEHFCCSSCNVSLQNQAFSQENNNLFCERCYHQFHAPKCAHCDQFIAGNCINALGKTWHPEHFVCTSCNQSFGSDTFLEDHGRPYCVRCFENLFSAKCGKCGQAIGGGESYVEALNMSWHSECFSCTQCDMLLEGSGFYIKQGLPFCSKHK